MNQNQWTGSPEVASMLGITVKHLNKIISRHHSLRPATKFGKEYVWTQEEIEALRHHRATSKVGGYRRKSKQEAAEK